MLLIYRNQYDRTCLLKVLSFYLLWLNKLYIGTLKLLIALLKTHLLLFVQGLVFIVPWQSRAFNDADCTMSEGSPEEQS